MASQVVKGIRSVVQNLYLFFAPHDYQPISTDSRKRRHACDVLEERDGQYPSYAASGKRICTSDVKTSLDLISEEEYNKLDIKAAIDPTLFSPTYEANLVINLAVITSSMESTLAKEDVKQPPIEPRNEASHQDQELKAEYEALKQQFSDAQTAVAEEVQKNQQKQDVLVKQLADRKRAVATARFQRRKAVGLQRKKAATAARQTQFLRVAAGTLAVQLRKKNSRLSSYKSEINKLRDTCDSAEYDKSQLRESFKSQLHQAKEQSQRELRDLAGAKHHRPDVVMEDAGPDYPTFEQLEAVAMENMQLRKEVARLQKRNLRKRTVVRSHNGLMSPPASSDVGTTRTPILRREIDHIGPFGTPELSQQSSTILDMDDASPFGFPSSFEDIDEQSASSPAVNRENQRTVPDGAFDDFSYSIVGQESLDRSPLAYRPKIDDAGDFKATVAGVASERDLNSPLTHDEVIEESIEQPDGIVRSPYAEGSSYDTAHNYTRAGSFSHLENGQKHPARRAKNMVKNHVRAGRSSGSQTSEHSRAATAGITKPPKLNRKSERYSKRPVSTSAEHTKKRLLEVAKPASSSLKPRYPWMEPAEGVTASVAPAPIDLKTMFYGEGFDVNEASNIQVQVKTNLSGLYSGNARTGRQYWDKKGELVYYANRGQQNDPLIIMMNPDCFDSDEDGEQVLPLTTKFRKADPKQKHQYAQACIIAQVPETQYEAARASLSVAELKAFEKRSFGGRKPTTKCYEERQYPKMFDKVVAYLRSDWRFKRAAKIWAAEEPALDKSSCWPTTFTRGKEHLSRVMETETDLERRIDEAEAYKGDYNQDFQHLTDRAKGGLELDDGRRNQNITIDDLTKAAGWAGLESKDTTDLPSARTGLESMLGVSR